MGMTRALDEIAANGHEAAITPEALASTSPYLNEHLNRFGSYELDLSKPPALLLFKLPPRLQPSRHGAATVSVSTRGPNPCHGPVPSPSCPTLKASGLP